MPRLLAMFWLILGSVAMSAGDGRAQPAIQVGDVSDPGDRIVSLTDGSIFRGEVLEYVPRHHLTLRLATGQAHRIEWAQIKRVVIARPAAQASSPPRAETPAAPPVRRAAPVPSQIAAAPSEEVDPERAAAYHEHFRRAKELYEDEQFSKALAELEAAYRLWPKPVVLYSMARAHHQLRHYREAYDKYQLYLSREPNIPEDRRAQIQTHIVELTAAAQQERVRGMGPDPFAGAQSQEPDPRFVYRRRTGMLVTGAILLPVSYLAALGVGAFGLTGATALTGSYSESTLSTVRWTFGSLFIPVAGPFVSAGILPDIQWSLPWILVDGAAQVTGLALVIAGSRMQKVLRDDAQITLLPYRSPNSTGLVLAGSF